MEESALAQPSGLVNDGKFLYVVDSEGSAVRKISTNAANDLTSPTGEVTTIAGTHDLPRGRSLFEFGDVDAKGDEARFQHPLGLAIHDGTLYVTDSYNHKIKQVDLATRAVTTWIGNGKAGAELDPLQLAEPAGITIAGGKIYVADTNNHRIVVIDMNTKKSSEFTITGLTPPQQSNSTLAVPPENTKAIDVERQELSAADKIEIQVELVLPEGFKLNPLMPVSYKLKADENQSLFAKDQLDVKQEVEAKGTSVRLSLPTVTKSGEATAMLSLTYGYCRDGNGGVCKIGTSHWKIPIVAKPAGQGKSISLKAVAK